MIEHKRSYWWLFLVVIALVAVAYVVLAMDVHCPRCGGSGALTGSGKATTCSHCHGKGTVSLHFKTMVCENNTRVCPQCGGVGQFSVTTTDSCAGCGGTGVMPRFRRMTGLYPTDARP